MVTRKVLVVDDEVGVRHALGSVLQGYQLSFAPSSKAALQLLDREPVDLLLGDHALLEVVKARHPAVLRVMLAEPTEMQQAIAAVDQGAAFRFLLKPLDELELKLELYFAFKHLSLSEESVDLAFDAAEP
jgi:DNA-binding NtrC family response regulator